MPAINAPAARRARSSHEDVILPPAPGGAGAASLSAASTISTGAGELLIDDGRTYLELGLVEAELERRVAADRILDRALALWTDSSKPDDPRLAPTLLDLGRWLGERGRCPTSSRCRAGRTLPTPSGENQT
ncbi:MAG: tetratricopeptide repeat protein, partial [Thermoanaerobaculia bacterium]